MSELRVRFYDTVSAEKLKFAVIVSRYKDKWVWVKHRERSTYEIPGGHREPEEDILTAAKRELYEETGAVVFDIRRVCVYSVCAENGEAEESFGMLYYAEIFELEPELHSEIERIGLWDEMPPQLTYPQIQPFLFERVKAWRTAEAR